MITAKVTPLRKSLELIVDRHLSPAARSQTLATFAKEKLAEAQAQNARAIGRVPPHETYVDGVAGKVERDVRPEGRIVYEFELSTDLVSTIDQLLIQHSPVRSGTYARSHVLFADGVEVDPENAPAADEFVFVNAQPYARKIEGIAGKRPSSPQAPDGVYEAVAAIVQRRFANVAKVRFQWWSLRGGAVGKWAQSDSAATLSQHRKTKRREWLTRQPAIIVTMR